MLKLIKWIFKGLLALVLTLAVIIGAYVFWLSGSSHEPENLLAKSEYQSPGGPILIFGGNRATGLEIVRGLVARGESVTVAVRATSDTQALDELGVKTVIADALNADEVKAALASDRYAAVISTLGTTRGDQAKRPDYIGNRHVIDAAVEAGTQRFVFITVIGAGDSKDTAPWPARNFLREVIALKTQAEEHLQASGLDYTIIRPGGLTDRSPTGTAMLAEDPQAFSYIARQDLAALTIEALGNPQAIGKIFAAYDPSRPTLWYTFSD
jgi:nucleoside-diphosphate-sugar epimerase